MTIQFHEEIAKTMKNLAKCKLLHIKFQLLFSKVVIQSLSKNKNKCFNKLEVLKISSTTKTTLEKSLHN